MDVKLPLQTLLLANDGTSVDGIFALLNSNHYSLLSFRRVLEEHGLVGSDKIDFCGVIEILDQDLTFIFLPKTSHGVGLSLPHLLRGTSSQDSLGVRKTMKLLLAAVAKYFREKGKTDLTTSTSDAPEYTPGTHLFHVAQALIEQWRVDGPFRTLKVERGCSGERVDWQRTLATRNPFWSLGEPVFFDPVYRSTSEETNSRISQIHRFCTLRAVQIAGWLEHDADSLREDAVSDYEEGFAGSPQTWLEEVRMTAETEFSEDRLYTLKLMMRLLEELIAPKGPLVAGTRFFHVLWEKMCSDILGNQYASHFKSRMPQPVFLRRVVAGEEKVPVGSSQIPDILIEKTLSSFDLVDAKYYDVEDTFPTWSDIGKQLLYAVSVKAIDPHAVVDNHFIFPKNSSVECPTWIELRLPDETPVPNIDPINCHYWNMDDVLAAYVMPNSGTRDVFRNRLTVNH